VKGKVYFIGAGPGDPELLTVKGKKILEKADFILYADSLVSPEICRFVKSNARVEGSSHLHLDEIMDRMIRAAQEGQIVARVHSGDPSLYGAIQEQIVRLNEAGIPYEVIPGVSSVFAAAARLGIELTVPEKAQTLILTRIGGRTPMPPQEELKILAAHQTTLAIFLSVSHIRKVVEELKEGGYGSNTPVAVLYRVTWPDEQVILTTLDQVAEEVIRSRITKQAIILVGPALQSLINPHKDPGEDLKTSRLYDRTFSHLFRKADFRKEGEEGALKSSGLPRRELGIIARSYPGAELAEKLYHLLPDSQLYLPQEVRQRVISSKEPDSVVFYNGSVISLLQNIFTGHRGLILCMPLGIVVRVLGKLARDKRSDPAVVVVDEAGRFAISVLSGHSGGANPLAQQVAGLLGGQAVITTASEVHKTLAVDLLGKSWGWHLVNPNQITPVSAAVINGEPVGIYQDAGERNWWSSHQPLPENIRIYTELEELRKSDCKALILITHWESKTGSGTSPLLPSRPMVIYRPKSLVVGIGCTRGISVREVERALFSLLEKNRLAFESIRNLATIDLKKEEPGLKAFSKEYRLSLDVFSKDQINTIKDLPHPSEVVFKRIGVWGVCEPAALLSAQRQSPCQKARLLVEKYKHGRVTLAIAEIEFE
jgi:precorrin-4 C11-methyltransferase